MPTIHAKLIEIQKSLKAPKNQMNKFGNYRYRSCEDILEAVKPLVCSQGLSLTISDEVLNIGDRFYVRATATLFGEAESVSTSALAREEEQKKGMDGAQITGAASSYARKYALNGLFCIDDTKDADTKDNTKEEIKLATPEQVSTIIDLQSALEITAENWSKTLQEYKVKQIEKLSEQLATDLIGKLNKKLEAKNLNQ